MQPLRLDQHMRTCHVHMGSPVCPPPCRYRLLGVSVAAAPQRGGPALHPAPVVHFIQTAFSLGRLPASCLPQGRWHHPCAAPGPCARHAYRAQRPPPQTTQCPLKTAGRQGMKQPMRRRAAACAWPGPAGWRPSGHIGRRRRRCPARAFCLVTSHLVPPNSSHCRCTVCRPLLCTLPPNPSEDSLMSCSDVKLSIWLQSDQARVKSHRPQVTCVGG